MDRDGGPDGHGENPGAGRQPLGAAFWTLWTASGLSNLADGVLKIALPLIALRYTDSPTLLAGSPSPCRFPGCSSPSPRARSPTGATGGGSWWRLTPSVRASWAPWCSPC
jgi:hypothetical protein